MPPKLRKALSKIPDVVAVAAILVAVVFVVLLVALAICHIIVLTGGQPQGWSRYVVDLVFRSIGVSPTGQTYAAAVNAALSVTLILVTVWFSSWSVFNLWNYRRKLRQQQCVQNYPIHEDGVDDIRTMEEYYTDAEEIITFAGDFSWVKENNDLQQAIQKMGSRVKFVSSKTQQQVRDALGDPLFNELRQRFVVFESGARIKCSFIIYRGSKTFLYRTDTMGPDRLRHRAVCALHQTADTGYLLDAIEAICRKIAGL